MSLCHIINNRSSRHANATHECCGAGDSSVGDNSFELLSD